MFKLKTPLNVPMELYKPTLSTSSGIVTKTYPEKGELFFGNFKTYGGTEVTLSGVYSVENTGNIETWYRPDITPDCRIRINGQDYEILGQPENIDMRNQFLKFKVRLIQGGA